MIVSFSLENWMSFRDKVKFSMVASRERQHGHRVAKLRKYQARILPIAAIYGGNAAGKTNFFKALNFAKTLVVEGSKPGNLIPVEPFLLDDNMNGRPSWFCFELLIDDDTMYEFSFTVTSKVVLEEKLVKIKSNSEEVLYYRHSGKPNFHASLAEDQFLLFAFQGTRDNQLFLTNSVSQNVENFREVYDWFKDRLELCAPDSRFAQFEHFLDAGHRLYSIMNDALPQLDTGIAQLGGETIPFEDMPLREDIKAALKKEVKEGATVRVVTTPLNERFIVTRNNGELTARKLVTYHPKTDGTNAKFEIRQESDGSQRVIDLLPVFLDLLDSSSKKVYVVDEVDRSLHTLLTRKLIESYLDSCTVQTRAQLLFTTHDVLLINQQLLRRDEMWVAERDANGVSNLFSFSDYKNIRYDKDIRKSYLLGRFGGIPRILLSGGLTGLFPTEDSESND